MTIIYEFRLKCWLMGPFSRQWASFRQVFHPGSNLWLRHCFFRTGYTANGHKLIRTLI